MFKMFKVGELFDIHPTTAYKMQNSELFASDGTTPVLSNSSVDNGIGGYCGLVPTERGGIITFSDTTTGADTMFYQSSPFIGYPHVQGMYPYQSDRWNEKCCLYVISCIRKSAGNGWSYAVKFNRTLVKELPIELPVIESSDPDHEYTVNDIDWQYMQERIAELERDRIAELDAYLKVTGLDDYTLTDEDKKILSNVTQHEFKEFKVKDVLNVEQSKSVIAKANLTEGDIPYVTRTVSDNGYMGTCGNKDKVNKGNCITIGAETGVAFYQPNDFVAGNKVYRLSREGLDMKEYLFLASVLNMQTKNYSYSNARIPEKIKAEKIFLPIIENSDPNHEYTVDDIDWQDMERYIRAMEKVVIADVVKYKDRVIDETRKLVS